MAALRYYQYSQYSRHHPAYPRPEPCERLLDKARWIDAGNGWRGAEPRLRLKGWSRDRRIVMLCRRLQRDLMVQERDEANPQQLRLSFAARRAGLIPDERLPLAVIAPAVQALLGTRRQVVLLSADTLVKQLVKREGTDT